MYAATTPRKKNGEALPKFTKTATPPDVDVLRKNERTSMM